MNTNWARFAGHQAPVGGGIGSVAAQQPMRAEQPKVAQPGDRRTAEFRQRVACCVLSGIGLQQQVDLGGLEAGEGQLEIDLELADVAQLEGEQLLVPAGKLGQPVVGDGVGPLLRLRQLPRRMVGTVAMPSSLAAATRP